MVNLHFLLLNLLAAYRNVDFNYFPSFHTQQVITCRVFDAGRNIGSFVDPNFFLLNNLNSIQVQMIHVLFVSINLVLTALKQYVSIYLLHIETQELITFRVFDAGSKTEFANNSLNFPKTGKLF